MKLRSIVLAGVAAAALSAGPAKANDTQGLYLGLGVGYDHQEPIRIQLAPPVSTVARVGHGDNVMAAGSYGYKWSSGLRLEFEASYSWHDTHPGIPVSESGPPFAGTFSGSNSLSGALVNYIYDWNLSNHLSLSLGGGVGAGNLRESERDSFAPALKMIRGGHTEIMWQGIAGLNYEFNPETEIFLDYRYRSAEVDRGYSSDWVGLAPVHVFQAQEHVAMLGVRFYMEE